MIPYSLSTVMINYYHSTRRIHLANLLNMADNFLFMALSVLALVISYVNWHSIGWAILHGLLGWIYVVYYVIRYGLH